MRIQKLTEEECFTLLRRVQFARLACARDGQPYVIPIYLAYSEVYLYGFSTAGQKIEWMRENPKVCVQWDEVASPGEWTSVIVLGEYEELVETSEKEDRQFAHDLLEKGHALWWQPGTTADQLRENAGILAPVYFRVRIGKVTGRRAIS